ncbi:MAG: hypothetical protein OEX14_06300, partial [Paracoccaceae bacterium]|nr:hypothetical protein [Paracoccaceae bacterium]
MILQKFGRNAAVMRGLAVVALGTGSLVVASAAPSDWSLAGIVLAQTHPGGHDDGSGGHDGGHGGGGHD